MDSDFRLKTREEERKEVSMLRLKELDQFIVTRILLVAKKSGPSDFL